MTTQNLTVRGDYLVSAICCGSEIFGKDYLLISFTFLESSFVFSIPVVVVSLITFAPESID